MNVLGFLLLVLVLLFVLTGVPAGAGLLVWRLAGRSRNGEQSCGKCGYSVRHLTTFNCPECGADFREVGIRRQPGSRRILPAVVMGMFVFYIVLAGITWAVGVLPAPF